MISFNNCAFTDALRLGQPRLHLPSLGVGVGSRDCDREPPPQPNLHRGVLCVACWLEKDPVLNP